MKFSEICLVVLNSQQIQRCKFMILWNDKSWLFRKFTKCGICEFKVIYSISNQWAQKAGMQQHFQDWNLLVFINVYECLSDDITYPVDLGLSRSLCWDVAFGDWFVSFICCCVHSNCHIFLTKTQTCITILCSSYNVVFISIWKRTVKTLLCNFTWNILFIYKQIFFTLLPYVTILFKYVY